MNRKRRLVVGLLAIIAVLAAALTVTWRSLAVASTNGSEAASLAQGSSDGSQAAPESPVPGGPGLIMLNPYAFMPQAPECDWGFDGAAQLFNVGAASCVFGASLSLPNGATVNKFVVYLWDDSPGNLTAYLVRCHTESSTCEPMAGVLPSWDDPVYKHVYDASISNAVVDVLSYSYYVYLYLPGGSGSDLRLVAARVDYSYGKVNVPLVLKDH